MSLLIKGLWSVILVVLIGYLAVALLLFLFQRNLLYFPDSRLPTQPELDYLNLTLWPSSENYQGLISQEPPEKVKGTMIVFHGNAGSAADRLYYVKALGKQGFRVLLAEYPGYGGRAGSPSETELVEDALQTIAQVHQQFGGDIYLWGESLGSGVVASVISKVQTPIKGLVLFTPWDSLPAVAQTHYWYLPARWLVKDRFHSIKNMEGYQGNVAVILAGRDEVIPVSHGQNLYESIGARKQLWFFENAAHNTVPLEEDLNWWVEVSQFISQ